MTDLFDFAATSHRLKNAPLAERMRPKRFEDVVGQSHLIGPGKFLSEIVKGKTLPSLIFWGPPGTGKTTLAFLLAHSLDAFFEPLSAVTSHIKEVKEVIEKAEERLKFDGRRTLLFIDEIHRFNKAQQDAFLPHVEKGTIILIGATTENPSFEVISPLLSRARVLTLNPLSGAELEILIARAAEKEGVLITKEALEGLAKAVNGDARRALNTLEVAISLSAERRQSGGQVESADIEMAIQERTLLFDKKGEGHYNTISAFIKSMRGSDPDAALYYLARLLEAGEDPLFVARRMVIFASEDIGCAHSQALLVAVAAMQAFQLVGMPEGWIPLAHAASYLASSPKSNASYLGYKKAKAEIQKSGHLEIPLHLRNAPTKLMKELDYGKGYLYPHDFQENIADQSYLPETIRDRKFYEPSMNGYEATISAYLAKVRAKKS